MSYIYLASDNGVQKCFSSQRRAELYICFQIRRRYKDFWPLKAKSGQIPEQLRPYFCEKECKLKKEYANDYEAIVRIVGYYFPGQYYVQQVELDDALDASCLRRLVKEEGPSCEYQLLKQYIEQEWEGCRGLRGKIDCEGSGYFYTSYTTVPVSHDVYSEFVDASETCYCGGTCVTSGECKTKYECDCKECMAVAQEHAQDISHAFCRFKTECKSDSSNKRARTSQH